MEETIDYTVRVTADEYEQSNIMEQLAEYGEIVSMDEV
jgi:hypothetical protein